MGVFKTLNKKNLKLFIVIFFILIFINTTIADSITDTIDDEERKFPYSIDDVDYSVEFLYGTSGGPDTCGFWINVGDVRSYQVPGNQRDRVRPNGQAIYQGETYDLPTLPLTFYLDTCSEQATFTISSGGEEDNEEECRSHWSWLCENNIIYWYDSCGDREDVWTNCEDRDLICIEEDTGGECSFACEPLHNYRGCYDVSVWWYNSCDEIEELYEYCGIGKTCSNAQCVENCVSHYSKACYNEDVWWRDSCNDYEEIAEDCEVDEECDPINDICIPSEEEISQEDTTPEDIIAPAISTQTIPKITTETICGIGVTSLVCGKKYEEYVVNENIIASDIVVTTPEHASKVADEFLTKGRVKNTYIIKNTATNRFIKQVISKDYPNYPDRIVVKGDKITIEEIKTTKNAALLEDTHTKKQFEKYSDIIKKLRNKGFKVEPIIKCNGGCNTGETIERYGTKWKVVKKGDNFVKYSKIKNVAKAGTIAIALDTILTYGGFSKEQAIKECMEGVDDVFAENLVYYDEGGYRRTLEQKYTKAIIDTKKYCSCKDNIYKVACCVNIIKNYHNRNELIENNELCTNKQEEIDIKLTGGEFQRKTDIWAYENEENLTKAATFVSGALCVSSLPVCATAIIAIGIYEASGIKENVQMFLRRNQEQAYRKEIKK